MLFIYRYFLHPLFLTLSWLARPFHHKSNKYFEERKTYSFRKLAPLKNPIWIHISSGELEYAKPIIEELKDQPLLITYYSTSVLPALKKSNLYFCASPYDTPYDIKDFLNFHQPKCLLIARSDLWPEMLFECKKRNIPTILFSASLNSERLKSYVTKKYYQFVYGMLTKILTVSKQDQETIKSLTNAEVKTFGDFRFLQAKKRALSNKHLPFSIVKKNKILILASTWQEDENIWLPLVPDILNLGYGLVLVPHEVHDKKIQNLQQKLSSKTQLSTSKQDWLSDQSILIVNQVGILADLYSMSDVTFVGGSFKKKVHSVMEPLASGNLVMVGPFYKNNREAIEFSCMDLGKGLRAVQVVNQSEEILSYLKTIYNQDLSKSKQDILEEFDAKWMTAKHGLQFLMKLPGFQLKKHPSAQV